MAGIAKGDIVKVNGWAVEGRRRVGGRGLHPVACSAIAGNRGAAKLVCTVAARNLWCAAASYKLQLRYRRFCMKSLDRKKARACEL